jgi:hypothetical protein
VHAVAHSRKATAGEDQGSKNRKTLVAEALLKGEEVELVRKAVELAKAGDVQMLKFLLDRILPKERSVRVDLPVMDRSSDELRLDVVERKLQQTLDTVGDELKKS